MVSILWMCAHLCVCVCMYSVLSKVLVKLVIGLSDAESYTCSQGYAPSVCVSVCMCVFVQNKLVFRVRRRVWGDGILGRVRMSHEMATLHTNALLCLVYNARWRMKLTLLFALWHNHHGKTKWISSHKFTAAVLTSLTARKAEIRK